MALYILIKAFYFFVKILRLFLKKGVKALVHVKVNVGLFFQLRSSLKDFYL
jgi:hypothetical protein